jgi:hypothetical protein
MGESAESLFRSGAISGTQASKHGLKALKGTRYERDNEEKFDGKQGRADQGGHKLKGHEKFRTGHIDGADQGTEKKKNTGFKFDNKFGNSRGSPGADEIDEGEHQKPDFPKAGGSKRASKGGRAWEDGDEGVDEINARSNQRPDFPRRDAGSKAAPAYAKTRSPNLTGSGTMHDDKRDKPSQGGSDKGSFGRIKKRPAQMGGYYGGGSRNTQ